MTHNLTHFITRLQATLLDDGTLFTTATCTEAYRHALEHFNSRYPIHGGTLIDTVADQYEYELTAALAGATPLQVTDVLLADPSGGEQDTPLTFRAWSEDERHYIRLQTPQAASEQLIVRFTQAHTIDSLDSATETTLPDQSDMVLVDGAAAQACMFAAAGKIMTNNLDPQASENYRKASNLFNSAYEAGLKSLTRRKRLQSSVPDVRAWNDNWHDWPN